jgi:hypothetical protein
VAQQNGPGRGKGRFTAPGVQADQEARISAIEDYLSDQIEAGNLSEPEAPIEQVPAEDVTPGEVPEAPGETPA